MNFTPADTARLVRKQLKAQFPGVKFTVKTSTYANGAHLSVKWAGGPDAATVAPLLAVYEDRTLDALTDLAARRADDVSYGVDYVKLRHQAA